MQSASDLAARISDDCLDPFIGVRLDEAAYIAIRARLSLLIEDALRAERLVSAELESACRALLELARGFGHFSAPGAAEIILRAAEEVLARAHRDR